MLDEKKPAPARKLRGKFYEDYVVGEVFDSPRRTITLNDINNFSALSGDFGPMHSDFEYCAQTPAGQPVAHTPLVYAIMGGLNCASGVNDGTLLAVIGIDAWKIHLPVVHGDTIHMRTTVLSKRETSKPDRGIVTLRRECMNQRMEVVHSMTPTFMYKRRPVADA